MDSKKLKSLANANGIVGLGGGIFLLFATPITVAATLNQNMMAANLAILAFFMIKVAIFVLGIVGVVQFKNSSVVSNAPSVLMIVGGSIAIIPFLGWIGGILAIIGGSLFLSSIKKFDSVEADNFKWTKADFDALTVGDSLTGVGGANYDEIVAKYGKPKTSSDTQSGDYTVRNASWSKMTSNGSYESVDLSFTQQQDGSYLLSMKNSSSLN